MASWPGNGPPRPGRFKSTRPAGQIPLPTDAATVVVTFAQVTPVVTLTVG